jgi:hypothetical protein
MFQKVKSRLLIRRGWGAHFQAERKNTIFAREPTEEPDSDKYTYVQIVVNGLSAWSDLVERLR